MKTVLLTISCCILAIAVFAPANAVGKITVDPNTSAAKANIQENKDFWTVDQRLAQNVTFEARRKTVLSILSDISSQTGVILRAGHNSNDWQVRDRKMVIFTKDIPLSDLMQSISRTMKFKWSRTEVDGVYIYRLSMDRKTGIEAEAEAARAEERFNREQRRKREALADGLKDLAEITGADLAQLREQKPMSYTLAASGMAGSLNQLFKELPGARDAFTGARELMMSRDQMSEQVQGAMIGIAQAIAKMDLDSPRRMPNPEQFVSDPELLKGIRLYPSESSDDNSGYPNIMSRSTLGNVEMIYSNGPDQSDSGLGFPIFDPDSSIGKGIGKMLAGILDSGSDQAPINGWSINVDPEEMKKNSFGETLAKHEEKLEIPEPIDFSKLETSSNAIEQYINQLAKFTEITKLNIVSDSFAMSTPITISNKAPADSFLKTLELVGEYNWWKRGSTIELRDRHWFRKRSLEIPEAWLEKWRGTMKKTGTLEIDDLADMALLVGEKAQYAMNIVGDPILDTQSMKFEFQRNIPFLRLYATLDTKQRSSLYTSDGLDFTGLTSDQKQRAKTAAPWWDGKSPLRVMGTREKAAEKQLVYKFISMNGYSISYLMTPKYEPQPLKGNQAK